MGMVSIIARVKPAPCRMHHVVDLVVVDACITTCDLDRRESPRLRRLQAGQHLVQAVAANDGGKALGLRESRLT